MSNKHNPYLRLFTRDIEGSPKINALSMAASGLYFRLLNRFNEPPMPGSLALHEWEVHNNWKRSLTQQCLACPSEYGRLQYFAKFLSKVFQWKSADILKSLQELHFFGIVKVEGDRLIQPRMYRDNGYKLASDDMENADFDPATGAANNAENMSEKISADNNRLSGKKSSKKSERKNAQKSTKKNTEKNTTTHARGHSYESEYENNNNDNIDNVIDKRKSPVAANPPSLEDVQAYFDERAQQGKSLDYITAEEFYSSCETDGWTRGKDRKPIMNWKTFAITCNSWRQNHGDKITPRSSDFNNVSQTGQAVRASKPAKGKFKPW